MNKIFACLSIAILAVSCGTAPTDNSETATPESSAKQDAKTSNTAFADGQYTVNAALSTCNWVGTEITTNTHTGTLDIYKGSVSVVDNRVNAAFVALNMSTINVTDLSGDAKASLEGHLKSEDFFGVEKYPFSELKLESIKTKEGQSYAGGILNIRGISHPISFPVDASQDGNQLTFDGDMTFDRSKYNVKFRSGSFPDLFPDLGDKLINDEITISFHIVAES
jgi:polyisoprenoid-binding protein YceI